MRACAQLASRVRQHSCEVVDIARARVSSVRVQRANEPRARDARVVRAPHCDCARVMRETVRDLRRRGENALTSHRFTR
jgi:hypothetical protein